MEPVSILLKRTPGNIVGLLTKGSVQNGPVENKRMREWRPQKYVVSGHLTSGKLILPLDTCLPSRKSSDGSTQMPTRQWASNVRMRAEATKNFPPTSFCFLPGGVSVGIQEVEEKPTTAVPQSQLASCTGPNCGGGGGGGVDTLSPIMKTDVFVQIFLNQEYVLLLQN